MRVLLVNVYVTVTGGADRHCLDLARVLRARGHSVRFLATRPAGAEKGAFVPLSVSFGNRTALDARQQLNAARRSLWNSSAAAATTRLLADFKPDVVHAHKLYPQLSVAPVVCAHRAGLPVIQTAHDFEFVSANPGDDRRRWIDHDETELRFGALNTGTFPIRRLSHARRVSTWITVSHYLASVYAGAGIDSEVIENFTFSPAEDVPPYEARRGALFLGRLVDQKGIDDVLELAAGMPQLDVTVAGFGAKEKVVRTAADALPNLRFAGSVDSIGARDLLKSSRVILMPSRAAEAGSLTALEGMAVGTPIVAFAAGGLAEYVRNAGAGPVVPKDASELARAAWSIHEDRDRWRALSDRASAAIRTTHSPERYVDRLEDLYERAIRHAVSA